MKRPIIKIDQALCTGCGNCIPNCPEGAIQLIDGKARLISDLFCDGLGACIGECPVGAITTEIREAAPYDEREVMKRIIPQGFATIRAHLSHLLAHEELDLYHQARQVLNETHIEIPELPAPPMEPPSNSHPPSSTVNTSTSIPESDSGCASSGCSGMEHFLERVAELSQLAEINSTKVSTPTVSLPRSNEVTRKNFPVQLQLVPLQAPYFQHADILIAADCVPATMPNFYSTFVHDVTLLIACPKLDNVAHYIDKLTEILRLNPIRSVHVVIMEVPCCSGLVKIVRQALHQASKSTQLPLSIDIISTQGHIMKTLSA